MQLGCSLLELPAADYQTVVFVWCYHAADCAGLDFVDDVVGPAPDHGVAGYDRVDYADDFDCRGSGAVVGLQTVTTVVDVPAAVKRVTITEDTVKGKVFALAKKGFFDAWKTAKEVHKRLIDDANYCTHAAVNEALNQLVKDGLFGMKHTDRNRWKLAPNVVFEESYGETEEKKGIEVKK